jgi:hypothetical protein
MALALPWEVTRVATAMPSLRDWVFQDEKCLGGHVPGVYTPGYQMPSRRDSGVIRSMIKPSPA